MPKEEPFAGYIDDYKTGAIFDRETGQTYSNYAEFTKAYEERNQGIIDSFYNAVSQLGASMYNSVFSDNANKSVYQRLVENQQTANQAMTMMWAQDKPYDPSLWTVPDKAEFDANVNSISSSFTALSTTLASNASAFVNSDSREISEAGRYLQRQGVNPAESLDMPDDFKKEVLQNAKLENSSPAWDRFVSEHRALTQWLQDPYNYARVKDDIKPQSTIASMLQSGALGAIVEDLRGERGRIYWEMANGKELSEEQQERIKILNATLAKLDSKDRSAGVGDLITQTLGGFTPTLGQAIETATIGGGAGVVAGAVATPAGAVTAGIAGAGYGFMAGIMHSAGVKEGGNYFGDVYERTGEKPTLASAVRGGVSAFTNGVTLNMAGTAYSVAKRTGILEMLADRALPNMVFNFYLGAGESIANEELRRVYGIGDTQTWGEMLERATQEGSASALFGTLIEVPAYGFAGLRVLKDAVNETEIMKRGDKDLQAEVINAQVAGTSLQSVQVPAEAVVKYQNRPEVTQADINDYARIVPNANAMDRAMQTGEYLEIPLGQFLTINDDFANALLKDTRFNNFYSLQEYQDMIDEYTGQSAGSTQRATEVGETNPTEPRYEMEDTGQVGFKGEKLYRPRQVETDISLDNENGIYNMFLEAGNAEARLLENDARKSIENSKKSINQSEVQKEVDENLQDLDANLDNNPLFQAQKALSDSTVLPDFSLTLFGKEGMVKDARAWAKTHRDGFATDAQQAEVDRIATDYGFRSGAEFLKALETAPTRDELRSAVARQTRQLGEFTRSSDAELAIDHAMRKVGYVRDLMSDFAEGKDIMQSEVLSAIDKIDKATERRVAWIEKEIEKIQSGKSMTVNGKDITDQRIKMLNDQIKDAKEKAQEDKRKAVEKARKSATAKMQERVDRWKAKEATARGKLKEDRRIQLEYAKNKRLLKREAKKGQLTIKQARENAKRILASTPIGRIKNRQSLISAVQTASRKANRAYETGDYMEAVSQSNKVLSSLAYLRESYAIMKEKTRLDTKMAKFNRKKETDWGTEENYAQFQKLLNIVGLRNTVETPVSLPLADHLRNMGELNGKAVEIPPSIESIVDVGYRGQDKFPIDNMTLLQYQDLLNLVQNMYTAGKDTRAFYRKQRVETVGKLVSQQVQSIEAHRSASEGKAFNPQIEADLRKSGVSRRAINSLQSLLTPQTRLDRMEGTEGALHDFWVKEVSDRAEYKTRLSRQFIDTIKKAQSKYTPEELRKMSAKNIFIEEQKITVSKDNLIGLAMASGAEHNWRKMFSVDSNADGVPSPNIPVDFMGATDWSEAGVMNMLSKYLTARDWDMVETYWGMFDKIWKEEAKPFEKARTGFTPEDAPLRSFSLEVDGKMRNFKGGYFPLQRDARSKFMRQVDPTTEANLFDEVLNETSVNSATAFGTNQSQFKARTNKSYIVDLNYHKIVPSYLDKLTTDLAFRDWAYTARMIVKDPHFNTAVLSRYGDAGMNTFIEIATGCTGYRTSEAFEDMAFGTINFIRQSNALSAVASPSVVTQGLANVFLVPYSQPDFTVKDTINAFVKYGVGDLWYKVLTGKFKLAKEFVNTNYEMSPLLRDMGQSLDSELWGTLSSQNQNAFMRFRENCGTITTNAMRWVDNMTTQVAFRGLVDKGLSRGMSERDAIRYAEAGIRRMIPSDKAWEQAPFIRNRKGWQGMLSSLASFSVTMLNRTAYTLDIGRTAQGGAMMVASYIVGQLIMMPLITDVLAFRTPLNSDEDKSFASWVTQSVGQGIIGQVPIVGEGLRGVLSVASDEPYYGSRTPTGILSVIAETGRTGLKISSAMKEDSKVSGIDAFEAGLRVASMTTGVPMWFNNVVFNAIMYLNGDTNPQIRDLLRRRPFRERE